MSQLSFWKTKFQIEISISRNSLGSILGVHLCEKEGKKPIVDRRHWVVLRAHQKLSKLYKFL